MEGLTPGRIVHWASDWSGEHFAAIVTDVNPKYAGVVQLAVFDPYGRESRFVEHVPYDESGQTKGTWHWIERA